MEVCGTSQWDTSDSPLFKGGGLAQSLQGLIHPYFKWGGGGGCWSVFDCLFLFHVLMILCRKEVRYIRLVNYIYSNRYTLSSLRANLFLLPIFWVIVSLGNDLRAESLYLAIVTFGIVRDFVVWRLSLSIAGATSLHVTLSRVKVRQLRSQRITWLLIRLMDGLLIWLTCYWWCFSLQWRFPLLFSYPKYLEEL